jgi:hypothetical protein
VTFLAYYTTEPKEIDVSEFKLGDVVSHKSDDYRKWVVVDVPNSAGGVHVIRGLVDGNAQVSELFHLVMVLPCEIALWTDNLKDVPCPPGVCSGPCYAAENGGTVTAEKMTTAELLQAAAESLIGEEMRSLADEVFAVLDQYEDLTDGD